jgi:hypothetical protein
LSENQTVSGERMRLVVVAAAASAAASAAVSTAVTSSCELVGSSVPSVPAVAAVKTALVLGVAREEGAAASASSWVGSTAAAAATGAGCSGGGRSRSHRPAGTGSLGEGLSGGFLLHLLYQFDGDSGYQFDGDSATDRGLACS